MDSDFKRAMSPSLALLTLASMTPGHFQIVLEDENVNPIKLDDKPDLVGISVNVDSARRAYEISQYYRQRKISVILGGIHVSVNHEEALTYADSVCIGEAENLWPRILNDVQRGKLEKVYKNDIPVDPADIPIPARQLADKSQYLYTNIVYTSRGCPYKCAFCYNSCEYVHKFYRNRPIEHILTEIYALGTKQVMFIDDNFIGNIPWTKKFLTAIDHLGLTWHAAVSSNIGDDPELPEKFRAAGCRSLFIGFESLNAGSIRSVGKTQNRIQNYEKLIDRLHRLGIMVNASMVFGFDEDTVDVFKKTLYWLVSNKIETVTAHILTPYPGTKLYQKMHLENRIVDFDWNHYNTSRVVFKPKKMTAEQLYFGYRWLYREFYSFDNILKRLPGNGSNRMPYLLFNLGYRKFGKFTSKIGRLGGMYLLGKLARRLSYGIG